jgi:hypothetical protein
MTRLEFDREFIPMTKALQVQVVRAQADYIYDEHRHADVMDFALACKELGQGTPKFLPKVPFFRDCVAAAREMRLAKEKDQRDAEAQQFWARGPSAQGSPYDDRWAKCCFHLIRFRGPERPIAATFIREALQDPGFAAWCATQRTTHAHPQVPYTVWLEDQLSQSTINQEVTVATVAEGDEWLTTNQEDTA